MRKKKKLKVYSILSLLFAIYSVISLGVFSYTLLRADVVPMKYLAMFYGIILVIYILFFLGFFKGKNKVIKIITYFISTVFSIVFLVASIYINNTTSFLDKLQGGDYQIVTYSVVVSKEGNYKKVKDLKDKKIAYMDDEYEKKVTKELEKKIDYEKSLISNVGELSSSLLAEKVDAICVENSYLEMIKEEISDFSKKTKVIDTFKIKVKKENKKKKTDITSEPFILYISGIDGYGNVNSLRGRSDVNQLAIVNPKTHHILLVNTPRDYYVQLAGTTGLKDKLTHAGIYGIDKSIATLEDLYGISIDYYLRVNFDTIIKVVDVIGGIDLYSDTAFKAWTNPNVYIEKGNNHLTGEMALAYARERHAYSSGDRHRGQNQQQVITTIIEKMTSSTVLISRYNDILNSLSGSFQTNMETNTIKKFVKKQLDDMSQWTMETYGVDGSGSSNYTYSMGTSQALYVMEPNYDTVKEAKSKINSILKEK